MGQTVFHPFSATGVSSLCSTRKQAAFHSPTFLSPVLVTGNNVISITWQKDGNGKKETGFDPPGPYHYW